jgi:hypothetical protein
VQGTLAIVLAARRVAIAIIVAEKAERDAVVAVPEVAMMAVTGPKSKTMACAGTRSAITAKTSCVAHGMPPGCATGDAMSTTMTVTVLCVRCHRPCYDHQGNDGHDRSAHASSVAKIHIHELTPLGCTPLVTF